MKRLIVLIMAITVLLSTSAFAAAPSEEVMFLQGSAVEVGTMWGEVNRDSILKAYNTFISRAEGKEDALRRFAKLSIDLSKKINCSYWIDELNAIADTVGIDRELYIAFTFGRYRDLALLYEGVDVPRLQLLLQQQRMGRSSSIKRGKPRWIFNLPILKDNRGASR